MHRTPTLFASQSIKQALDSPDKQKLAESEIFKKRRAENDEHVFDGGVAPQREFFKKDRSD